MRPEPKPFVLLKQNVWSLSNCNIQWFSHGHFSSVLTYCMCYKPRSDGEGLLYSYCPTNEPVWAQTGCHLSNNKFKQHVISKKLFRCNSHTVILKYLLDLTVFHSFTVAHMSDKLTLLYSRCLLQHQQPASPLSSFIYSFLSMMLTLNLSTKSPG